VNAGDAAIPLAVCQGMEQAIRATENVDNETLMEWLRARTADEPVKTVLGDFYWDEWGLPIDRPFLLVQWQNGEPILYPKPDWR